MPFLCTPHTHPFWSPSVGLLVPGGGAQAGSKDGFTYWLLEVLEAFVDGDGRVRCKCDVEHKSQFAATEKHFVRTYLYDPAPAPPPPSLCPPSGLPDGSGGPRGLPSGRGHSAPPPQRRAGVAAQQRAGSRFSPSRFQPRDFLSTRVSNRRLKVQPAVFRPPDAGTPGEGGGGGFREATRGCAGVGACVSGGAEAGAGLRV